MKPTKSIVHAVVSRIFCVFVCVMVVSSCANSVPPEGGPRDKTPPVILFTQPAQRSLNTRPEYARFDFSKFVNKQQVQQSVFVTPSLKTEFSWAGKTFYVSFKEPLDSNTTIAVTIGTQYSDMQGNKPESAYTLIFSTGTRLDSGIIRGSLNDPKAEGVMVFLYPLAGILPDTLNPAHTKPKYRTQVGSKGTFEFQALANERYRIFALRDEFRNDVFDKGTDAFGAATSDISLEHVSTASTTLRIAPAEDIIPPKLFDVRPLSNQRLSLKFSEKLDTASIRGTSFIVNDSARTDSAGKLPAMPLPRVYAASLDINNPAVVTLFCTEPLQTGVRWRVTVLNDKLHGIKDSAGNVLADSANVAYFTAPQEADTLQDRFVRSSLSDSTRDVSIRPRVEFVFSGALDTVFKENTFLMAAVNGADVPVRITRKAANIIVLEPQEPCRMNMWYSVGFQAGNLRSWNGKPLKDSLVIRRFLTEDTRNYGGVTGALIDSAVILLGTTSTLKASSTTSTLKASSTANTSVRSTQAQVQREAQFAGQYVVILETKETPVVPQSLPPQTTLPNQPQAGSQTLGQQPAPAQVPAPISGIKRRFERILSKVGAWEFNDIPPGTYQLSAYCDANRNGRYDYGQAYPFVPAERYVFVPAEVIIRPRWTIENLTIVLPP